MVRHKSRYLLFQFLYPPTDTADASTGASTGTFSHALPTHLEFHSPSASNLTGKDIAAILRDSLSINFGDWGAGCAGGLSVKYFSPATSTGIVKVPREHYRLVWGALSFIREVKGRPVVATMLKVSGTIKKAEMEAVRRAKEEIQSLGEGLGGVVDDGSEMEE